MRKKWAVALVLAFLLLPCVSHALTVEQKVLVGVKGVSVVVVVENMKPRAGSGLTEDQLKVYVELRLRKAGVRVLTEEERGETPGNPYLYVNVSTYIEADDPIVAYSILVQLKEWVTLARGFETTGVIWQRGLVGTVGKAKLRLIRGGLGDQVDIFINDYLAANPKK
jgi:hypothetical protein